jgi:hypothetical protein
VAVLSRPTLLAALAFVVGGSASVRAHIVPIPPSVCTLDPLVVRAPTLGLESSVADPEAATLRTVYDANASTLRFCTTAPGAPGSCGDAPPRRFTLDGVEGTIALPPRFATVMTARGEVVFPDLPVTVGLGGATLTTPVLLTTGLVAAGSLVVEGAPLQGIGGWLMVGVIPGDRLPAPLGGHPLVLSVPCSPRPIPDRDQFVPPSRVRRLAGRLAAGESALRATVTVGPADRGSFATGPALFSVHVDDETVAAAVVSGWTRDGRRLTGTTEDGRVTMTVVPRTSSVGLTIAFRDVALAVRAPRARALVSLTLETGRLLARGERLFRADASGAALRRR